MVDFVPEDFVPPCGLDAELFRLRPLTSEYNELDYEAWTSSVDHIRRTPGYEGRDWPRPMSLEQNLMDLTTHEQDFVARRGFTYTILSPNDDRVIGCVYIYPAEGSEHDVSVKSWVRQTEAALDPDVFGTVSDWLRAAWPFDRIDYAPRSGRSGE